MGDFSFLVFGLFLLLALLAGSGLTALFLNRRMRSTFDSLAAEALGRNNEAFLNLARSQLERFGVEATGDLQKKEQAIRDLVDPLQKTLQNYDQQLRALEGKREQAYGSLHQYLDTVATSQLELRRETGNLVQALRSPQVRGKWGELSLVRVVELAGMVKHCDFTVQTTLAGQDSRLRPDLIVRLPNDRKIVVDAKVPLDSYLTALDTQDDQKRAALFSAHSRQLKQHVTSLASKAYWEELEESPEFVVLYIPLESLYSTALHDNPELIEKAAEKRVILATPTTLIALLKAVAYGWKQEKLAKNAEEVAQMAKTFLERLSVLNSHFAKIGRNLDRTIQSYNDTAASLERRVLPQARRLNDLGISTAKDSPEIFRIERTTRKPEEDDPAVSLAPTKVG